MSPRVAPHHHTISDSGAGLCACGCGERTNLAPNSDARRGWVKGRPLKFVLGHVGRTRRRMHRGYIALSVSGRFHQWEHRRVAELALGRALPRGAQVHHVDGNKQNNAPTNLVICQDAAYHGLLHTRARILRAGGDPNKQAICARCKRLRALGEFCKWKARHQGRSLVCRECKHAYDVTRGKSCRA